jgi:isochorismate synthase EntC
MSRWKQYQIKKQQRAKINAKLDRAFGKIADLLMNAKMEEAEEIAKNYLLKYPTHVKSWRLLDLVKAWREVVGPTITNMKAGEKRKVLKAITLEYKTNDKISAESLANKLRQFDIS